MNKKLKRKSFDEVIWKAYEGFLNGNEYLLNPHCEFHPMDTPKRSSKTHHTIWRMLIFKHINKIYYN
jgi:hypothetical protein